MLPTGLFIDAPEVHDDALHSLTNDADQWSEDIITKLKERIPESSGCNMIVKLMKMDEETGTATGSVLVTNGKKSGIVPVIVKDFNMYPLDIFIANNKLLPLTPELFKAIFTNNEMFKSIEEYPSYGGLGRFEDGNLWNVTYPPSLGRYAYASAGYPVLDIISSTISGEDLKKALNEDHGSALRFHKHGHAELIKKVANLRPVNMNEFAQAADNLIDRNIVMLRKEGPNKYTILSNSDNVFSPVIKQVKAVECRPFISKISDTVDDTMNEVDQNGEKLISTAVAIPDNEVYVEKGVDVRAQIIDQFDHYVVKKKDGVEVEGVGIPKVIDFNMNVMPMKIFIGKTMSTIQTEISGVRVENSKFNLPFSEPQIGQTGCFVFMDGRANGLATVPVTIKFLRDYCGEVSMKANDLLGKEVELKMSPSMQLERIAMVDDKYIIPKRMKWVPMDGFFEVSNSPADFAIKTASVKKTASPVTIINNGFNRYSMKGVDKYASAAGWDKTNLSDYEVRFMLSSLGASSNKVANILKTAYERGYATVHGLKTPPTKQEKIAKALPTAKKMQKVAESFKANLIKEASYIENSQTVDALLALNFVNPENISKFVSKVPSFKAAISNLASCLLASRLGVQEIPEQSVVSAMMRLVEVVNGLEALRATQEG
jgi:hypothetical protein